MIVRRRRRMKGSGSDSGSGNEGHGVCWAWWGGLGRGEGWYGFAVRREVHDAWKRKKEGKKKEGEGIRDFIHQIKVLGRIQWNIKSGNGKQRVLSPAYTSLILVRQNRYLPPQKPSLSKMMDLHARVPTSPPPHQEESTHDCMSRCMYVLAWRFDLQQKHRPRSRPGDEAVQGMVGPAG